MVKNGCSYYGYRTLNFFLWIELIFSHADSDGIIFCYTDNPTVNNWPLNLSAGPYISESCIQIKIFTLLCGASKGFMKTFKAFIKPFEAPQRIVKIKN